MSITINAIYENGVLKPLDNISLKEHEKVKIDINLDSQLKQRLKNLSEAAYKKTDAYSSDEIENDISQAYKEVKEMHVKN